MFQKLKTSERISLSFSLFTLAALFLFLISINIIYFFIWYDEQKQKSLRSMTVDYGTVGVSGNIDSFRQHLLTKNTIIIPENGGEVICSDGIAMKFHGNDARAIDSLGNALFYREGDKIFFIFSQYYPGLGEVKILFDTTQYVNTQMIIIQISLFVMLLFSVLMYVLGRSISKRLLGGLTHIAHQAQQTNTDYSFATINLVGPENDEIKILAGALNKAFAKIHTQTHNLKQFITDVSHEFKTPLMSINSKIDLYNKKCEKGSCSPNELQDLLLAIKTSTKKLNGLLETLFLFSRIQDGITCFDRKDTDIAQYITDEVQTLLAAYPDKDIHIEYRMKKNIIKPIESASFGMLFDNLMTNAIKFSPKNPRITLGLTQQSFWVEDNGVGIAKKDLDKIWNKFYRKDIAREGFGVGLFIVKRIIDLYGWRIEVQSSPNKGTKMEVFF